MRAPALVAATATAGIRWTAMPPMAAGTVGVGGEPDAKEVRHEPQRGPAHGGKDTGGACTKKEPHTRRREARDSDE